MKVTTKQLSVCHCGFLALAENIPLGTEYEIDPNRREKVIFICGGCGKVIPCMGIYAHARGASAGGFLPEKIFQSKDGPSITCPKCHRTSYHPKDIEEGYCGFCHDWTKPNLPVSACPSCGYKIEEATFIGKKTKKPKPGDFSLCFKCGEILCFKPDLTVRAAELNDLVNLSPENSAMLDRAQKAIRTFRPDDKTKK